MGLVGECEARSRRTLGEIEAGFGLEHGHQVANFDKNLVFCPLLW
jgi:hypothetical protein